MHDLAWISPKIAYRDQICRAHNQVGAGVKAYPAGRDVDQHAKCDRLTIQADINRRTQDMARARPYVSYS